MLNSQGHVILASLEKLEKTFKMKQPKRVLWCSKFPMKKDINFNTWIFCEFVRLSLNSYVRRGKSRAYRCYSKEVLERALVCLKNPQKVRERFLFDFDFVGLMIFFNFPFFVSVLCQFTYSNQRKNYNKFKLATMHVFFYFHKVYTHVCSKLPRRWKP